jgi:UrcA family protein
MHMNAKASHRRHPVTTALLLGALAGMSLAAQAGEPAAARSAGKRVVVSYADLDLTDPAGARVLYARLKAAAREVCEYNGSARDLRQLMAHKDCYDRALNKAVHGVDSVGLHALHAAKARRGAVG